MRERQVRQGSGGKYFLLLMMLIMGVGAWLFLGNGKESEAQETVPLQEAAVVPAAEAAVDGVKVLVLNYHKIDNKHHSLAVKPEVHLWIGACPGDLNLQSSPMVARTCHGVPSPVKRTAGGLASLVAQW